MRFKDLKENIKNILIEEAIYENEMGGLEGKSLEKDFVKKWLESDQNTSCYTSDGEEC